MSFLYLLSLPVGTWPIGFVCLFVFEQELLERSMWSRSTMTTLSLLPVISLEITTRQKQKQFLCCCCFLLYTIVGYD